jgi:hypothetical protein
MKPGQPSRYLPAVGVIGSAERLRRAGSSYSTTNVNGQVAVALAHFP